MMTSITCPINRIIRVSHTPLVLWVSRVHVDSHSSHPIIPKIYSTSDICCDLIETMHQQSARTIQSIIGKLTGFLTMCHCYANNHQSSNRGRNWHTDSPTTWFSSNCIWIELPRSQKIKSRLKWYRFNYNFISVFVLSWHNRSLPWFLFFRIISFQGVSWDARKWELRRKFFSRPVQLHWLAGRLWAKSKMRRKSRKKNDKSLLTGIVPRIEFDEVEAG